MPVEVDASLVRRLLAAQFPAWANLPLRPAEPQGWDNRTFRLGDDMGVRLPSAERYEAQVEKEQRWLPWLAPRLPTPIPSPVGLGAPGEGYPWPWSIHRWIEGEPASRPRIADLSDFAREVAGFLASLQALDASEGPVAGPHSFWRGGPLAVYDAETRRAVAALGERIDGPLATEVWEAALAAAWVGPPVWVHGDVAINNLLLADGKLAAVIDFGCCAVGDPACDLVLAWTLFDGESRAVFRRAIPLDDGAWARARGWALWKALIVAAREPDPAAFGANAKDPWRILGEVFGDYRREAGR